MDYTSTKTSALTHCSKFVCKNKLCKENKHSSFEVHRNNLCLFNAVFALNDGKTYSRQFFYNV